MLATVVSISAVISERVLQRMDCGTQDRFCIVPLFNDMCFGGMGWGAVTQWPVQIFFIITNSHGLYLVSNVAAQIEKENVAFARVWTLCTHAVVFVYVRVHMPLGVCDSLGARSCVWHYQPVCTCIYVHLLCMDMRSTHFCYSVNKLS